MHIEAWEKGTALRTVSDVIDDGGSESGNEKAVSLFEDAERKSVEEGAGTCGHQQKDTHVDLHVVKEKGNVQAEEVLWRRQEEAVREGCVRKHHMPEKARGQGGHLHQPKEAARKHKTAPCLLSIKLNEGM